MQCKRLGGHGILDQERIAKQRVIWKRSARRQRPPRPGKIEIKVRGRRVPVDFLLLIGVHRPFICGKKSFSELTKTTQFTTAAKQSPTRSHSTPLPPPPMRFSTAPALHAAADTTQDSPTTTQTPLSRPAQTPHLPANS